MSYYEDDYQPSLGDRLRFFVKIFAITFLVAGVGLLIFFSKGKLGKFLPSSPPSFVKVPEDFSVAAVLGARTQKAESIAQAISSDFTGGIETAKKQALNIKLGDILGFVSRAQKIPQDAHKVGDYVREQAESVVKSK